LSSWSEIGTKSVGRHMPKMATPRRCLRAVLKPQLNFNVQSPNHCQCSWMMPYRHLSNVICMAEHSQFFQQLTKTRLQEVTVDKAFFQALCAPTERPCGGGTGHNLLTAIMRWGRALAECFEVCTPSARPAARLNMIARHMSKLPLHAGHINISVAEPCWASVASDSLR
jgi:hypothetical protein